MMCHSTQHYCSSPIVVLVEVQVKVIFCITENFQTLSGFDMEYEFMAASSSLFFSALIQPDVGRCVHRVFSFDIPFIHRALCYH